MKNKWTKRHDEILKLCLEGNTHAEIAAKMGMTTSSVHAHVNSNMFRAAREKAVGRGIDAARKMFETRLVDAATAIINIMHKGRPDERLRFDAAKEVLYQCGLKPVEVVETRTRQYTPEEIQSSLETVKEIQTIEGTLSIEGSKFVVKREPEPEDPSDTTTQAPTEEAKVAD